MKEFPGTYPCSAHECTSPEFIDELIKIGNFDQVVQEILGITAWMNRGKLTVSLSCLESWISALPGELATSPEIVFTKAWILAGRGHFSKAIVVMEEVFTLWQRRWDTDKSDIVRQWLFYIKGAQGILHDHIGAIGQAHSCFSLAESFLPSTPQELRRLALHFEPEEELRLATEDRSGLSVLLIRALRVFQITNSSGDIARTVHNLGCQYLERGEADKAKYWLQQALDLRHTQEGQLPTLFSMQSLGQCYHHLGFLEEAKRNLDRCLILSTQLGSVLHQAYSLSVLGDVHRDGGNYSGALSLYNRSLEIKQSIHDDSGVAETLLGKATLYARQGEYALSLNCVREAQSHAHGSAKLRLLSGLHYEIAQLSLNRGANPNAFAAILQELTRFGYKRDVVIGTWYLAYSQLLSDEKDKARTTLLQALQMALQCSQVYTLSQEICSCLELTRLAFDEAICPEALAGLVTHSSSETLSLILQHIPSALAVVAAAGRLNNAAVIHIELLGEFKVSSRGTNIDLSATRSQKAVLLLKYLAANQGTLVAREQIIEAVWPGSSLASAEHSFEVAISTLRKLLDSQEGPSIIVRKGRAYQLHPELHIHTDVKSFIQNIKQGYWWVERGQNELARSAWEEAEALYKGDFLQEDIYADWAGRQRERLKEKYLDIVLALGELALECRQLNEAIERASFVVGQDPLRESGYRLLMKAHFSQGNRGMALRDYQRCEQALMLELGEEPMPETQELMNSIRSNALDKQQLRII